MAVGALEPRFFVELLAGLGIDDFPVDDQYRKESWVHLRSKIANAFAAKTRDEWVAQFSDADACVWPVLSLEEAPLHPLNVARGVFIDVGGVIEAGRRRVPRRRHRSDLSEQPELPDRDDDVDDEIDFD